MIALWALAVLASQSVTAAEPLSITTRAVSAPHIRQIEEHLLPAVLLDGEPAQTTTLIAKMRELGVPGVGMAYFHRGRIAWTESVGVRQLGGPAVDADTVFQAASISKPVTAVAVMALQQSGVLNLDRDVRGYLRTWSLPADNAESAEPVTIRRLLSHTAGMSVHGFEGYASDAPLPSLIQVLNGEKPANSPPIHVVAAPGSVWSYSGGGYEVLQQLLTDLTNTPFEALAHDLVLQPAGMLHSSFKQPIAAALRANAATPYDAKGEPVAGGAHSYPEQAAAGLWTTPSDLARFAINLQRSLAGRAGGILSPAAAHEMVGPVGKGGAWGLGLRVGGAPGHPYFLHGGWNAGFRALLAALDDGDGIAIMTNGDAGLEITTALLRTVAAEYGWPEFQPKRHRVTRLRPVDLERYVGHYPIGPEGSISVSRNGDRLSVQIGDGDATEMTPESERLFFSRTSDWVVTFELDGNRQPTGIRVDILLASFEAARAP